MVISSPHKVALLEKAQRVGYRTDLYYIATDDPAINVSRVKARVNLGGHDVPEDKIVSPYARSLDLLMAAVKHTNRAYLFDNSRQGRERMWVAEITDGLQKLMAAADSTGITFYQANLLTYQLLRYGVSMQIAAGQPNDQVHLVDWEHELNELPLSAGDRKA